MKKMICTLYSSYSDGTLVLINTWIEDYSEKALRNWNCYPDHDIEPEKGISNILEGTTSIGNIIHVRIVKY